ncbi:MAG: hypothetical protein V4507_04730 [Verrucomicrobiota bacterium]
MKNDEIFKRAIDEIKLGNPCPLLNEKCPYPSEDERQKWRYKALMMKELMDSVDARNATEENLDRIKKIFILDPETQNPMKARKYLAKIMSYCEPHFLRLSEKNLAKNDPSIDLPTLRLQNEIKYNRIKSLAENLSKQIPAF